MTSSVLKKCDLHVHPPGCYFPEDLLEMAADHHNEIDWNRFDYTERYERAYGISIDPAAVFAEAARSGSLEGIRELAVCTEEDGGDFERFDVKTFLAIAVTGYWLDRGRHDVMLEPLVRRHRNEGIEYIEYRAGMGPTIFEEWHSRYAGYFRDSSTEDFTAKYIVRLYPGDPVGSYERLRELLRTRPDLVDTIVGVDFTGGESPPKQLRAFFEKLHADNRENPAQSLDAAVHVGEVFFDKSLESAIRCCHEMAMLGARRLGHCIAPGLDPSVAVRRRHSAHTEETVSERLDQIAYDLQHLEQLDSFGVGVDVEQLNEERRQLLDVDSACTLKRGYDDRRLEEIRLRQDFVLGELKRLDTVIEVCPTSNLRIAGIPDMEHHPVKKFYSAGVNMAICTDDPGVFDSPLASEVDLVASCLGVDADRLAERIGDPRRFRLAASRE